MNGNFATVTEYAKKKLNIKSREELLSRLKVIPEVSKNVFKFRWELSEENQSFSLDDTQKNDIELYWNAESDLVKAKYVLCVKDYASMPFDKAVLFGKLIYALDKSLVVNSSSLLEQLTKLNTYEQAIIDMRFGLSNGSPKKLAVVGKELKLTVSQVQQMEEKAMQKLRHNLRPTVQTSTKRKNSRLN